jgi:hypothetical protein
MNWSSSNTCRFLLCAKRKRRKEKRASSAGGAGLILKEIYLMRPAETILVYPRPQPMRSTSCLAFLIVNVYH